MEQSHEEVKDLLGAYVVGAVPPEEVPSIRAHLLTCDECMAEADHLSDAADSLLSSVEPVAMPPAFTRTVLERVERERAGTTLSMPSRRRWKPLMALSFAAVVVFAAVMGAIALNARQDADANRRLATALLGGSQGIELEGAGGVVAKVVPGETGAVFVATGLEDVPSDRTYQLWLMREGVPVSAGTFDVSEGVAILRTSRSPRAFDGAAVTIEPSGGSPQPTTEPVIQSA
ncbi:MAG: anti-sigma factor [Actinomycetota bacterium]